MSRAVRALLVEDNPGDSAVVQEELEASPDASFTVRAASTLGAAQGLLRDQDFDVVLLDLDLPDSMGVDTVGRVRAVRPDVPIVVISGLPVEARRPARELGAAAIVDKDALRSGLLALGVVAAVERTRGRGHAAELRRLLDAAPDATLVVRESGDIDYVNARAAALFGRTREELLAEQMLFSAAEDGAEIQMCAGGSHAVGELRVADLEWEGAPAFLVTIRDITQQRDVESRLTDSERLISLGAMAAGVVHEINNPLAAVVGNLSMSLEDVELLRSRAVPDAVYQDLVDNIQDSREAAERIRQIARDLASYSRQAPEALQACDLGGVLQTVARMARHTVRRRATLTLDIDRVPTVVGSETRLVQVFLNLVVNAAHAMADGRRGDNEIRVRAEARGEGRVVVEVQDTGPGIPEEVRARLFDPFFTTKGPGVGTGLGLTICQRIVREFGGEITFESQVGVGTTFSVELVADAGPAARAAPARREGAAPAQVPHAVGPRVESTQRVEDE